MTAKLPEDNDFRLGEGSSDDACSTDWENRGLDWKKKIKFKQKLFAPEIRNNTDIKFIFMFILFHTF